MEISNVSNRSMQYQVEQFSADVKMNRTSKGGEDGLDLSIKLTQFRAKVSLESFGNFNKQGSLTAFNKKGDFSGDDLLAKLRALHADSPSTDSNKPGDLDSLFGEDGHWGVAKTSRRISEFVLKGAGEDLERLKAGREGMLRGFQEAEKAWGGKLPEISYETMEKSLGAIDEKIRELGGSVIDLST
ncbi:MAG: hydrogenase-4 component G [Desulfamplus sp.]|nr:hydrogenase-4 component G [Desulfamplus sp.]